MADKGKIERLIREVNQTHRAFVTLANAKRWREIIITMRKPGWTTPAELVFVQGILESMRGHASALQDLQGRLASGSRAVGRG